jgi:mannose-1-phosphate guanylyltransferase
MLQRTVERVLPMQTKRILVITNSLQAEESARQLKEYTRSARIDIIEEPVGRNTAPAIGLAASIIARYDPDGVMLVLPADHYIADEGEFHATVRKAREAAMGGALVTMGIRPDRPETGYGYIEAACEAGNISDVSPVRRFVEKPPLEKAVEYMASGNFFWNSGMFVWSAVAILDKIAAFMPGLTAALAELTFNGDIWELNDLKPQIEAIYQRVEGESIDFGVMEKADNVVVIPAKFGWSDLGSWSAIPQVMDNDPNGNAFIRSSAEISADSEGCLVYGCGKLVALVGVKDLIVVDTDDALLVCSKDRAQDVKGIVGEIERRGLEEYL